MQRSGISIPTKEIISHTTTPTQTDLLYLTNTNNNDYSLPNYKRPTSTEEGGEQMDKLIQSIESQLQKAEQNVEKAERKQKEIETETDQLSLLDEAYVFFQNF